MATTFVALIALPLILYIPGLLITLALFGPKHPADGLARHYERTLLSALLSGWLALLLAEFGIFSLALLLGLLLVGLAPLALLVYRRKAYGAAPLGLVSGVPWANSRGLSSWRAARWSLAYAAVLLMGALLVARPFEVVLGGRDAGVYAVTGFAIARTGSIVQHDALLASLAQARDAGDPYAAQAYSNFFSSQTPERWIATRLRAVGFFVNEGDAPKGRVVPQFFHLYPAWVALLTSIFGMQGGLVATGLLATLGVWGVMLLGRTLAGPAVGLLAGLLLALNGVQVWFGRYSTSEATSQFLTFAALYAFARWQGGATSHVEAGFYAALVAFAAGQMALTRIDFFLLVGPLAAFLGYSALSRRWTPAHTVMLLVLGAMALHAGLHVALIARAYFFDTAFARLQDYAITAYLALPFQTEVLKEIYYGTTRSKLKDPLNLVKELAMLAGLLVATLAIYGFPRPLRALEAVAMRVRRPLLSLAALGLLLLSMYGYLVRPQILNADVLFNARGGWGDPLMRPPDLLRDEVQRGITGAKQARADYGVVFAPVTVDLAETARLRATLELGKYEGKEDPAEIAGRVDRGEVSPPGARAVYGVAISPLVIDAAATDALRAELSARRGPWRGPFSNDTPNWLRLQGYIGAPIAIPPGSDPRYTIALANMVRVGWYLSPLGVALAVVGLALWLRRGLNAASWLFFAVVLAAGVFYIRQSYGTADQTYIYILRRFMPVVYPAACLGAAYALVALWDARYQSAERRTGQRGWVHAINSRVVQRSAALALVAALTLFLVTTNQRIFRHTEYGGALAQLEELAARFEPNAIVIFRGGGTSWVEVRDVPDILMMPLRFAFGRDALVVKSEQPGRYSADLAMQVRRWQAEGRPVYLALSANGGSFSMAGVALEPAGEFTLRLDEFEQLSVQKPYNVGRLALPLAIYRVAPPDTPVPPSEGQVDHDSFAAQVRGFYRPEAAGFAWTNGDALVRLPYPTGAVSATLRLRLAGGARPSQLGPAEACVALLPEATPWRGWVSPLPDDPPFMRLGCVVLGEAPADYTFDVDPRALPPATSGRALVRLEAPPGTAWVPTVADPALSDRRTLGVQFYEAELTTARTP